MMLTRARKISWNGRWNRDSIARYQGCQIILRWDSVRVTFIMYITLCITLIMCITWCITRIMCITRCGRGVRQRLYWAPDLRVTPIPVTSIDMSGHCATNLKAIINHWKIRSKVRFVSSCSFINQAINLFQNIIRSSNLSREGMMSMYLQRLAILSLNGLDRFSFLLFVFGQCLLNFLTPERYIT